MTEPSSASLPRWHVIVAVALLLLHATLAWNARAFGITTGNDDATFLLLARSLREFGYSDLHLVGSPPHPRTPPGLPAVLAVLGGTFGEHFDLFLAVIVATSVAALALLYDVVRRVSGATAAVCVLGMTAVNPLLVNYAGEIMSEALYILLTVLTVWAVVRERSTPEPPRAAALWPAVAIGAACGAALTRTVGVTIVGALFLTWAIERRGRRLAALLGVAAVTVGGWILWTVYAPVKIVGRSYIADAAFARGGERSIPSLLLERLRNVPGYLTEDLPFMLPMPTVEGTIADNVVGLLVFVTAIAVGVFVLWKRARIATLYVVLYAGILAVWPWRIPRFIVPLLPFLFWSMIAGAMLIAARWRVLRPGPFVLAAIIIAAALPRTGALVGAARKCDRARAMASADCYAPAQRSFFALASYARTSLPDTAIFVTEKEGTFGYLSRQRALLHTQFGWGAVEARSLLEALRRASADYLVLTPLVAAYVQHVPALLEVCRDLAVAREFGAATYLLRVKGAQEPVGGGDACVVLERYDRESVGLDQLLLSARARAMSDARNAG